MHGLIRNVYIRSLIFVQGVAAKARVRSNKSYLCAICAAPLFMCIMCTGYRPRLEEERQLQIKHFLIFDLQHFLPCMSSSSVVAFRCKRSMFCCELRLRTALLLRAALCAEEFSLHTAALKRYYCHELCLVRVLATYHCQM